MRVCTFPDCPREYNAKGYCRTHYWQYRKGKPLTPVIIPLPIQERFWSRVKKTETCWIWTGNKTRNGYGRIHFGQKHQYAHRLSYEWHHGPIPLGHEVDHACRNRLCVNPEHLRAVTPKMNQENHGGPQANNASGIRGVSWSKATGKWVVYVSHLGRTYYCGLFEDIADAERAAIAKRNELHTHNDLDRVATHRIDAEVKR